MTHTEDQLIEGCVAGDRMCQTNLHRLLAPKMLGVCLRYARSREEAEEIMQEGFIRMFTYIKTYKGSGPFEGWVRKIMVNCALHRYQNKSNLQPIIRLENIHNNTATGTDVASDLDAKQLLLLVQKLPPAYRMVFNLYVFEGFKHREIAEALGISEGTSKSNLSDARTFLQNALSVKKNRALFKTAYG